MTKAQKFFDYYNELDRLFAKALNQSDHIPFSQRIKDLIPRNSIVRNYKDDLFQLGNLRNANSHQSKGGVPIAEPFEETVQLIQKILEEFKNPKRVIPAFQSEVFTVVRGTPLIDLLSEMNKKDFSQAPILDTDGKVIEVVSTNTVSRWLFAEYENQLIDLTAAKISDLMPHIETKENYALVSRNTTVYEAAEIYLKKSKEKKSQLDCLIITQNGKASEKLMGIVCIEDIAEYLMD
ncbi:Predicted transcriptional regulator with C-terminal CBS domains [Algoriphagus faecimaris]|uniref:Predicted transcriptional regulator with C-terminal CBS domains n=1 Tax=Algoriphagus faecimaris TaxID=686796 RepID=A0A1G6U0P4_9BACT|nr:CBS domain-containing protein [Algoriphagus faecimaris]SDD34115.1 Predicted transcriptional regulator with C-terminal CBS domains [Algoriphagus faecimaris]